MVCAVHLHNKSALELFTNGKLKLFDAVRIVNSGASQISLMVDSRDALRIPIDDIKKHHGKSNVGKLSLVFIIISFSFSCIS